MKKKMFFVFLSVCLMISCFSFAFADSPNVGGGDEAFATTPLTSNEESDYSSPACGYVLASANEQDYSEYELVMSAIDNVTYEVATPDGYVLASADEQDYSEYELVMSAIDDVTYEVAMPDGTVVGTLYMDNSENVAVPYSTSQEVNWLVPRNDIAHSTTYVDTTYGFLRVNFTMHAEPSGSTKFGFYCSNNRSYYWFPGLEGSCSGYFPASQGFGLVAFAIKNESDHTIRYTGSYTVS